MERKLDMSSLRQVYYDLSSNVYDLIIRLHSKDVEGSLRRFIVEKANLSKGDRALDLCTGTGSVAVELARPVGEAGLVICQPAPVQNILISWGDMFTCFL